MIPSRFIQSEIDYLVEVCNFTPDELQLFLMRTRDKSLVQCSIEMNISIDTAKKISRKVNNKIIRVL